MLLPVLAQHARGGEGGGPRFLFLLLMLALLGFVIAKVVRRKRGGNGGPGQRGSAMHTLQDRFARGEIDQNEYEHRKAVLVGADVVPPAHESAAPPFGGDVEPTQPDASDDDV